MDASAMGKASGAARRRRAEARAAVIRAEVAAGETRRGAARKHGVTPSTVRTALRRGKAEAVPAGLRPEDAAAWERAKAEWEPSTAAGEEALARLVMGVTALAASEAGGIAWGRAMRVARDAAEDLRAIGLGGKEPTKTPPPSKWAGRIPSLAGAE